MLFFQDEIHRNEKYLIFTNKKTNLDVSLNETIGIDKDGSEIVLGDIIADQQEEFIDIGSFFKTRYIGTRNI